MRSDRKVAVITGASQGMGAGYVKGFREIGYCVVANSRSITSGNLPPGASILLVDGDIADPDTAKRIVSAAIERFGRIDTLVNNAGVFIPKPFIAYSEADFMTITAVNLAGFFHISRKKVAAQMLEKRAPGTSSTSRRLSPSSRWRRFPRRLPP